MVLGILFVVLLAILVSWWMIIQYNECREMGFSILYCIQHASWESQGMKKSKEIINIYTRATKFAMEKGQAIGEKNDYYITLRQLEELLKQILDKIKLWN